MTPTQTIATERPMRSIRSPQVEDASEVLVGKFYDVPLVRWTAPRYRKPRSYPPLVPVIGPAHEDREIVGFDDEHWHIDWRFVPDRFWNNIGLCFEADRREYAAAGRVLLLKNTDGVILRGRRKCQREQILYPDRSTKPRVPWLAELEQAYAGASAKCGKCPHRGISFVGAPVVNGARVCPGHGLAWNVETGALQSRLEATGGRS